MIWKLRKVRLMAYSNLLNDVLVPLILDTSVVINLNASGSAAQILAACPNRVIVPDIVVGELAIDSRTNRDDQSELATLVQANLLETASIPDDFQNLYHSIISGEFGMSLDDGEAATLTLANATKSAAVLDERKARRLAAKEFATMSVAMSFDFFTHPTIWRNLDGDVLATALYRAVKIGRMRVSDDQLAPLIDIIGLDRAKECASIPRKAFR